MGVMKKLAQEIADAEIAQDLAAWELDQGEQWWEAQDILSEQRLIEEGLLSWEG